MLRFRTSRLLRVEVSFIAGRLFEEIHERYIEREAIVRLTANTGQPQGSASRNQPGGRPLAEPLAERRFLLCETMSENPCTSPKAASKGVSLAILRYIAALSSFVAGITFLYLASFAIREVWPLIAATGANFASMLLFIPCAAAIAIACGLMGYGLLRRRPSVSGLGAVVLDLSIVVFYLLRFTVVSRLP